MMLAASSASGSWQYLLASTRHASASCTWGHAPPTQGKHSLVAAKVTYALLGMFSECGAKNEYLNGCTDWIGLDMRGTVIYCFCEPAWINRQAGDTPSLVGD